MNITLSPPEKLPARNASKVVDTLLHSKSKETLRAYQSRFLVFRDWCKTEKEIAPEKIVHSITPALLVEFLCSEGESKSHSWRGQLLAAIKLQLGYAELPDCTTHVFVRDCMSGLRKKNPDKAKQVAPLTETVMQQIKPYVNDPLDWAIMETMRSAQLRRSEAEALTWEDVQFDEDGTGTLFIRKSKSDQEAKGAFAYLTRSACNALKKIQPELTENRRVFNLSARSIARRIRKVLESAGLKGFSGHSPRVGMTIDLAQRNASVLQLQQAGRWKSPSQPAYYIRNMQAKNNAVATLMDT